MASGPTIRDLQRAGAIAQLCVVYDRNKHRPNPWEYVREYACREFRDCGGRTIAAAVERCKAAVELAAKCEACTQEGQIDVAAERRKQGG